MSSLGANGSIQSGGSGGISKARILALINETTEPKYLKIADADDQYAPRARSVQLRCTASGLTGTSALAVASTFAGSFPSIDASRVTAYIDDSELRLVISCDETNITSVKDTMASLDAVGLQARLPPGVLVSTSDALSVGTALLTKSNVPILLLS